MFNSFVCKSVYILVLLVKLLVIGINNILSVCVVSILLDILIFIEISANSVCKFLLILFALC